MALIISGDYREKESKRVMRMRKKQPRDGLGSLAAVVGADRSEITPEKIMVSRSVENAATLGSKNQEIPTFSLKG